MPKGGPARVNPNGQIICEHYAQCGGLATFVMGNPSYPQQYAFCKPGCTLGTASVGPTFGKFGGVPRMGQSWDGNEQWKVIMVLDQTRVPLLDQTRVPLRPSVEQVTRVRRDNVV